MLGSQLCLASIQIISQLPLVLTISDKGHFAQRSLNKQVLGGTFRSCSISQHDKPQNSSRDGLIFKKNQIIGIFLNFKRCQIFRIFQILRIFLVFGIFSDFQNILNIRIFQSFRFSIFQISFRGL